MTFAILGLYLLLGSCAGLLAGLLGVGGGLVIVPVLAMVFTAHGIAPGMVMQMAVGTSLATIVMTSISSVATHHRHGAVLWPAFWRLVPGIILGALLGAVLADHLPSGDLRIIFGVFELLVALQLGFGFKPSPHRGLPGMLGMGLAGLIIGTISALIGIGGGTLSVPFLTWCNVAMRQAVATSAACGLPIALGGAVGFVSTGLGRDALPPYSTGYIYWPAFGGVVLASMLFAPLGARLAHKLPAVLLKRIFAVFVALLGVRMLTL